VRMPDPAGGLAGTTGRRRPATSLAVVGTCSSRSVGLPGTHQANLPTMAGGQVPTMATMGAAGGVPPSDPWKVALPKANSPPSEAPMV
jgi:hypothetical protein